MPSFCERDDTEQFADALLSVITQCIHRSAAKRSDVHQLRRCSFVLNDLNFQVGGRVPNLNGSSLHIALHNHRSIS